MKKKGELAERLKNIKAFEELFSQGDDEVPGFEAIWYARDGNMDMYFMGYENAVMILLEWFLKPSDENKHITLQITDVIVIMNLEEYKKGWALLSGGKDSTLAAVEMSIRNKLEGVVYIDTGIGLNETKEYVEEISSKFGWDLKVFRGYTSYDSYVLKHGFPTPSGHSQIMHILKLDAVRRFISWHKREIGGAPLLFSGVRRSESSRRSHWARRIQFYQGAYWDCPIFHYDDDKVWELHYERKIPINSAYGTIGKSGDCLCGAFGNLTEKKVIEKYYPYLSDHISHLEENTKSNKYSIWGNTDKPICAIKVKGQSEHLLCSECSLQ